jgi:hypothetical protein
MAMDQATRFAGGIIAARSAGPSTAIWPSTQSRAAPTGRNPAGRRATWYFCMSQRLIAAKGAQQDLPQRLHRR